MPRWLDARTLSLLVFPIALAAVLTGPNAIGTAEGCSGGPNQFWTGWHRLEWTGDAAAPTDAVVVLEGTVWDIGDAQALAGVHVNVTDPSSSPIAGTTAIVELSAKDLERSVAVIWKPIAPLSAGTTYAVDYYVDDAITGPVYGPIHAQGTVQTLSVNSAGALPPSCTAMPSETTALVGELVSCESNDTCHPGPITFPGTERDLAAMTIECAYPAESTSVYQLTRVEAAPGKGQLHAAPAAQLRTAAAAEDRTFHVTFADELSEYCVRVVTQNLATGVVTQSPELCVPRVDLPATESPLTNALGRCAAPPNEDLKDEWCAVHPGSEPCGSSSIDAGGSDASENSSSSSREDTGEGCTLGARRPAGRTAALVLAIAALALRRRRIALRARIRGV